MIKILFVILTTVLICYNTQKIDKIIKTKQKKNIFVFLNNKVFTKQKIIILNIYLYL